MARQDLKQSQSNFNPGARLLLVFAAGFLLLSIAQVVYRFTLPTDGWAVYTTDLDNQDWVFDTNLVGVPSDLQTGDILISVDGVSTEDLASLAHLVPPSTWQPGQSVTMIVQREDQQIAVDVPVVNWTGTSLWRYNVQNLPNITNSLGAMLVLVIGWFTFLRRPALPSARALLLLSTAIGASTISGILPDGLSVQFDRLAFGFTGFFSYIIFGTFLAPSLLTFALVFPRPKKAILRHPWLAFSPYGLGLAVLIYFIAGGEAPQVGWIATLGMFTASVVSLVHAGFTQRDAVSRAQLRWAISGFVLGLGLFMLIFPLAFGWVTHPALVNLLLVVGSLGGAVIGISFAIAVLRYRLFDIDLIIRRTLIYAALTGTLAVVYFAVVVLLQRLLPAQSQLTTVISTLTIAALFSPLRRRIQNDIDRLFYRRKYNAEQTLAAFSATTREEVNLDRLSEALLGIVEETMQPEGASLWIKTTDQ